MAKKRTRKWFLIAGLGVVVIIALLPRITYWTIWIKERQDAKHWLQEAEKSAGSTTTYKDAYQWFVDNGFEVRVWDPHKEQGWLASETRTTKDGETLFSYHIVQGSRPLIEDTFFTDASWIDLRFRFDTEQNFKDVQFIIRRFAYSK